MKHCSNCGNPLPDDAGFCPQCGQAASGSAPDQSAPEPTAAPPDDFNDLKTRVGGLSRPPVDAGASLSIGELFHQRYTIEEKLGEGAMGLVYKAADKVTGRAVALKLINPALLGNDTAVQRLIKEGLVARDIRHPNIIAMHDVGQADGQTWLVMEYVEGESLRRWLQRALKQGAESGADIPYRIAWNLISNILDGLQAAHAAGVIHRDLKPENIMLLGDPEAGDYRLKILDFGIAHAMEGNAAATMTTTSSSTGTAYYMAPEQKTAADTVTASADLYAVTVMFYELLIGVPPEGRWQLPSKERNTLNSAVDAVIEKGLANRPRSRFTSAQDYLAALQTIPPLDGGDSYGKQPDHGQDLPIGGGTLPPNTDSGWWARRSGGQKLAIGIVVFLLFAAVLDELGLLDENPSDTAWTEPADQFAMLPGSQGTQTNSPPDQMATTAPYDDEAAITKSRQGPDPVMADFSGVWADQLEGNNFAHAVVKLSQSGSQVSGTIYLLPQQQQVGNISGTVKGRELNYRYTASDGSSGAGRGILEADNRHIQIQVRADGGYDLERHRLHLDHMPN